MKLEIICLCEVNIKTKPEGKTLLLIMMMIIKKKT